MRKLDYSYIIGTGLGLLLLLSPAKAQYDVDIFGYFEPQYMAAVIQNDYIQMQSNKLRVDLSASAFEKVYFVANFDFITYHGYTSWNILDYLPDDITSVIPPEYHEYYVFPFENQIFLDNAYLKFALKHLDITVGRQQISLGSGYVWNPTDMFNIKDVLDPTYEQPGHNAIRLDVPIGSRFGLMGLYSVGDDWKASDKIIQLKGGISRFDFEILAAEKIWTYHDYTQIDPETFFYVAMPEKRKMIGGSLTGEIFGPGVWAEYSYSFMESTEDFYELTVGMDYTFNFQSYVLFEYYRNTLAKENSGDYDFNDWLRYMTAEQKAICKDQVYGLIQHPITDLMYLGMSGIYSISDNSTALIPTLNYFALDNLEILLYLNFYLGSEGTAYASNLGNGGMIRARIYF